MKDSYYENMEISDDEEAFDALDGFDDDDLIEARLSEARNLERDMLPHVRQLGFDDARVVIDSLSEGPAIAIYDLRISPEEASELIRRLSPQWDGQSCQREWYSLPDAPEPVHLPAEPATPKTPEPTHKKENEPPPKRHRKLGGFIRRKG